MARLVKNLISNSSLLLNVHKRCISTTNKVYTFHESDEKGGYKDTRPYPSFKERMIMGFSEIKKEIALWKEEVRDRFEGLPEYI